MRCLLKLFAAAGLLIAFSVTGYSQDTITHLVKRGETLESIAERYGTTSDSILALNPDASDFVYVGMALKIPVVKSEQTVEAPSAVLDAKHDIELETSGENAVISKSSMYDGLVVCFELEWNFLNKGENMESATSSSVGGSAGFNYFFSRLYVGGRIGAVGQTVTTKLSKTEKIEAKNVIMYFPAEVGYALGSERFAVIPNAGLELMTSVKSKVIYKELAKVVSKEDGKTGGLNCGLNLGLRFRICAFNVSGFYRIPMGESYGAKGSFGISIGFGF